MSSNFSICLSFFLNFLIFEYVSIVGDGPEVRDYFLDCIFIFPLYRVLLWTQRETNLERETSSAKQQHGTSHFKRYFPESCLKEKVTVTSFQRQTTDMSAVSMMCTLFVKHCQQVTYCWTFWSTFILTHSILTCYVRADESFLWSFSNHTSLQTDQIIQ